MVLLSFKNKNNNLFVIKKMDQGLVLQKKNKSNKNKNTRYTLQEKIGSGTFSDVWLATAGNKKVAIKVILPIKEYYYYDAKDYEKKLLKHIQDKKVNGVIQMLDSFTFYHEKKRYYALVFDLLGISMYQFQKNLKKSQIDDVKKCGLPIVMFQKIAREFIETLADLHEKANVIHTDLKPENLVFGNQNLSTSKKCVLIDFGSAVREGKDHKGGIISTRQYRAPEVILGNYWSYPADIWSYGCILFELFTGDLLFRTHNSLEHLNLIEKKLQTRIQTRPRDARIFKKYFHQDPFKKNNFFLKRMDFVFSEKDEYNEREKEKSMEKLLFSNQKEDSRRRHILKSLVDLLKKCLQIDPEQRITARQALEHPFFSFIF